MTAEDPYAVLGVRRNASDGDIRRAFRRLAKELHPDVKPNDLAAAERFKKVSLAYDILGDTEKRRRFDRGEIDAAGEPRHAYTSAGGPFGGFGTGQSRRASPADDLGFGDIFSDLFGGRGRGAQPDSINLRGRDVRYTLEVDFLEAVQGVRKRVTLPEGAALDLAVPEGVEDGQVLRLKGKGQPGVGGGQPGDAHVEISVRAHADYERDGDNILLQLPIAIDEAILGAKIEVPTISGPVNLTIPKATSSGRKFRLRGKGVRNVTNGTTGDQIVTVTILLPERVDDSLSYFMSEWRQTHKYDPRKKVS
ncbi:MAG: DnaJ C-terminal domain-containing protein [Hyphomicrobiaceae bacterium]